MSFYDYENDSEYCAEQSIKHSVKAFRVYLDNGHEFTMLARFESDVHKSHAFYGIEQVRQIELTEALIDEVKYIGDHHLPLAV